MNTEAISLAGPQDAAAHDTLFHFEQDFAGSLRCIPMAVRLKLDLCGIKLTLRQWSQLSHDDRQSLLGAVCTTPDARQDYHDRLVGLISFRCDEPVRKLVADETYLWRDQTVIPECIVRQADQDGVASPTPAAWHDLSPLERFALVKLARSSHENENFVPAMREFGLLQDQSID
ncbi:nitrate reductase associated protein [Asaia krungthepensis]|uniref:Nitrate reductase associated protein n=1 Tax=Asaia krungthepensis NRIC 0535 TaxID=1307925 RepID=A0ABQ0Q6Z0_9PROT|nr:nitrate reductase associated protein [Asaia krungthepensis]GBQ94054.1 hypothetical protein AA0535_3037 [Asaia krungthepensis NRIC 0535]